MAIKFRSTSASPVVRPSSRDGETPYSNAGAVCRLDTSRGRTQRPIAIACPVQAQSPPMACAIMASRMQPSRIARLPGTVYCLRLRFRHSPRNPLPLRSRRHPAACPRSAENKSGCGPEHRTHRQRLSDMSVGQGRAGSPLFRPGTVQLLVELLAIASIHPDLAHSVVPVHVAQVRKIHGILGRFLGMPGKPDGSELQIGPVASGRWIRRKVPLRRPAAAPPPRKDHAESRVYHCKLLIIKGLSICDRPGCRGKSVGILPSEARLPLLSHLPCNPAGPVLAGP